MTEWLRNTFSLPRTTKGAVFSESRKYRYVLWRTWAKVDDLDDMCVFVGLNPSTADELRDDPTIRRCCRFAVREGYDGMWMLNLWGYRATSPKELKALREDAAEGPCNHDYTLTICRNVNLVILAWGNHGAWRGAGRLWFEHMAMIRDHAASAAGCGPMRCFGTTTIGEPRHPLYLAKDAALFEFLGYGN